jgi:hypothetical protein
MEEEAPAESASPENAAEVESVFSSAVEACHNRNLAEFLSHFTSSRSKAIRAKMKKAMEEGVEMRISSVDSEAPQDGVIKARCKYFWDSPNYSDTNLVTSDFTLKIEAGRWRIDTEKVIDSRVLPQREFEKINFAAGIAADDGFVDFGPKSDEEEFPAIPKDARTYEGSCANGRCGTPQP